MHLQHGVATQHRRVMAQQRTAARIVLDGDHLIRVKVRVRVRGRGRGRGRGRANPNPNPNPRPSRDGDYLTRWKRLAKLSALPPTHAVASTTGVAGETPGSCVIASVNLSAMSSSVTCSGLGLRVWG